MIYLILTPLREMPRGKRIHPILIYADPKMVGYNDREVL
jgi:hypothetical protein